jgi:hypothetical protein
LAPVLGSKLEDALVLETQEMPSAEEWRRACDRAAKLFGVQPLSSQLSANNIADLVAKVRERAADAQPQCEALVRALARRGADLGVDGGPRLAVAREGLQLLTALEAAREPVDMLRRLAAFEPQLSAEAVSRSIARAEEVQRLLEDDELWRLFEGAWSLDDAGRRAGAAELRRDVVSTLHHDELAQAAASRLRELRDRAVDLLAASAPTPTPPEPAKAPPGWETSAAGGGSFDTLEEAEKALDQAREALRGADGSDGAEHRFELTWVLRIRKTEDGG